MFISESLGLGSFLTPCLYLHKSLLCHKQLYSWTRANQTATSMCGFGSGGGGDSLMPPDSLTMSSCWCCHTSTVGFSPL